MHGGLFSEDGVTLEDLRKIDRNRQPPDSGKTSFQTQLRRRGLQEHNFFFFPPQVPCVTFSGQIHSRRSVSLHIVYLNKHWHLYLIHTHLDCFPPSLYRMVGLSVREV